MEEDKPFGGPDQDFVFGEFAKAEYEVCRKQVVGIVPGISFDDFPGRDVQKVDSGVECPYPQPAAVGKQAVDIGCRKRVGDRIFVCQRFLQVRDAPVCHIQDVDTGLGCDPVRILTTLLDVANLYIWDDCFRFPVVPVVKLESCPVCPDQYSPIRHEAKLGEVDRIFFFLFSQYRDTGEFVCLRFVEKQVAASGEDRLALFVHRDVYHAYLLPFGVEMRTAFA